MRKQDVIEHFRLQVAERRRAEGKKPIRITDHAAITEMAEAVGLTVNAVYRWPELLDFARQCVIEVVTRGAFRADHDAPATRARERKAEAIRERLGL